MSNCQCTLNCACQRDKPLPVRIVELMKAVDEAKAEVMVARNRYEQAKMALQSETQRLDTSKVYAVRGGVLVRDGLRAVWVVKPLEVPCGS